MVRKIFIALTLFTITLGCSNEVVNEIAADIPASNSNSKPIVSKVSKEDADIYVYKSPDCGCCKTWIDHLENEGMKVAFEDVQDVSPYKDQYGVPYNMASCHTGLIKGYAIEGHVPAWDIERLIKEKPDGVVGLSVPRMPKGTPGMEMDDANSVKDPYDVVAIKSDGTSYVFTSYPKGGNKKEDGVKVN